MRLPRHIVWSVVRGYNGKQKKSFFTSVKLAQRALKRSFLDRSHRYRRYRAFWNVRVNAASREWDFPMSKLMQGIRRSNMKIDRKNLAALAMTEPVSFKCIVDEAKRVYYGQYRAARPRNLRGF